VLAFGGEACPSPATLTQWRHARNSTRIFNIYGTTEVSSWAMCYEISPTDLCKAEQCNNPTLSGDDGDDLLMVPLGDPLLDTCVELRNECGNVITSGTGEIWIGM